MMASRSAQPGDDIVTRWIWGQAGKSGSAGSVARNSCDGAGDQRSCHSAQAGAGGAQVPCVWASEARLVLAILSTLRAVAL